MVGSSLKRVVLAALVAASFTTAASAQQTGGLPALSDQVAVLQQIVSTQQSSLASLQTLVTTLQTALAAETQQPSRGSRRCRRRSHKRRRSALLETLHCSRR